MSWLQKMIDEHYGGDAERYEADRYENSVKEGRLYAIDWQDLELAATTLPELENQSKDLIERRLGYLPHDSTVLGFEPFLRGLIQGHQQGHLTDDAFSEQAEAHIKLVRNFDLRHNACLTYHPMIYQNYERYLSNYRQKVKSRLVRFLGYEPELKHSLIAEIWLCDVVAQDTLLLPAYITVVDIKAHTLIKYRECLLEHGQAAADVSPLLGIEPAIKRT